MNRRECYTFFNCIHLARMVNMYKINSFFKNKSNNESLKIEICERAVIAKVLVGALILLSTIFNPVKLSAAWQAITDANTAGRGNFVTDQTFHLLYGGGTTAIRGDFNATGNSILWSNHPNNANLISDTTTYKNEGGNAFKTAEYALGAADKKNSSSARLILPPYVKGSDIIWATLFWQGQVFRPNGSYNDNSVDATIVGWNKVTLRDSNGVMHKIEAPIGSNDNVHKAFQYTYTRGHGFRHHYGAQRDVTSIIRNSYTPTNNTFTVGNIKTTAGKDNGGWVYIKNDPSVSGDYLFGLYGGWSLVVAYNVDSQTAADNNVSLKNVTIFDGFDLYLTWSHHPTFTTTVNINGFLTPKSGTVHSKLLLFGGAGDRHLNPDQLKIRDKSTATFSNLSNAKNPVHNQFNHSYTYFGNDMDTAHSNKQGMDLDIYDVSGHIDNDQTSTDLRFGVKYQNSGCDQIFPQIIGFSTELYQPDLCYDAVVSKGNNELVGGDEVNYGDEVNVTVTLKNRGDERADGIKFYFNAYATLPYQEDKTSFLAPLQAATDVNDSDTFYFNVQSAVEGGVIGKFNLNAGTDANSTVTTNTGGYFNVGDTESFRYAVKVYSEENITLSGFNISFVNPVTGVETEGTLSQCTDRNNTFWGRKAAVRPEQGAVDAVDIYTNITYTGGAIGNTNGNGPGPDITTKIAGETMTFDVVYLGDGSTGPTAFSAIDGKEMPVLLYEYEYNTSIGDYSKGRPLLNANGQIAYALIQPGAVAATSIPLYIPNSASKNVKIGLHFFDLNGNSAAADKNCYQNSASGGNLQDVPNCMYDENNIEDIYGITTKMRCTAKWAKTDNPSSGSYGACTDGYGNGITPTQAPYDVEPTCLSCLLDNNNTDTSVDAFAIRPKDFTLNATNVVQADDATIVLDQTGPHPVNGVNKLRAGEDYNLSVLARNDVNTNTLDYNQSINLIAYETKKLKLPTAVVPAISPCPVPGTCADVNVTAGATITQFDNGVNNFYDIRYNEVGIIDLDLNDTNWAAIDNDDTPTSITYNHYAASGTVVRRGLAITGPLRLTIKPYAFNITAANLEDEDNGNGFTYLSNDFNMSAQLPITVQAVNKGGFVTKNYSDRTRGLYEQSVSFNLNVNANSYPAALALQSLLPTNVDLNFGYVATPPSLPIPGVSPGVAVVNHDDENVTRFNFNRGTNTPVNPFKIDGLDVNLSITDSDDVTGDANGSVIGNATFVYGRVHMARTRGMCDSTQLNGCPVNMIFYFEFYGDKDANKSLINTLLTPPKRSIDSVNWYQNTAHNTNLGDGNVSVTADNIPGAVVYVPNGGSISSAIYTYTGSKGYPFKGTVKVTAGVGTQSWLIYDKYNAGATKVQGELEFYGPGEWSKATGAESSIHNRGDANRNSNTNRRIRW